MNSIQPEDRKAASMRARQELKLLMDSIFVTAKTHPLPRLDPETMAIVLIEELETIWHLMSPEAKTAMAMIVVTLQHRKNGVVAGPAETSPRAKWWQVWGRR